MLRRISPEKATSGGQSASRRASSTEKVVTFHGGEDELSPSKVALHLMAPGAGVEAGSVVDGSGKPDSFAGDLRRLKGLPPVQPASELDGNSPQHQSRRSSWKLTPPLLGRGTTSSSTTTTRNNKATTTTRVQQFRIDPELSLKKASSSTEKDHHASTKAKPKGGKTRKSFYNGRGSSSGAGAGPKPQTQPQKSFVRRWLSWSDEDQNYDFQYEHGEVDQDRGAGGMKAIDYGTEYDYDSRENEDSVGTTTSSYASSGLLGGTAGTSTTHSSHGSSHLSRKKRVEREARQLIDSLDVSLGAIHGLPTGTGQARPSAKMTTSSPGRAVERRHAGVGPHAGVVEAGSLSHLNLLSSSSGGTNPENLLVEGAHRSPKSAAKNNAEGNINKQDPAVPAPTAPGKKGAAAKVTTTNKMLKSAFRKQQTLSDFGQLKTATSAETEEGAAARLQALEEQVQSSSSSEETPPPPPPPPVVKKKAPSLRRRFLSYFEQIKSHGEEDEETNQLRGPEGFDEAMKTLQDYSTREYFESRKRKMQADATWTKFSHIVSIAVLLFFNLLYVGMDVDSDRPSSYGQTRLRVLVESLPVDDVEKDLFFDSGLGSLHSGMFSASASLRRLFGLPEGKLGELGIGDRHKEGADCGGDGGDEEVCRSGAGVGGGATTAAPEGKKKREPPTLANFRLRERFFRKRRSQAYDYLLQKREEQAWRESRSSGRRRTTFENGKRKNASHMQTAERAGRVLTFETVEETYDPARIRFLLQNAAALPHTAELLERSAYKRQTRSETSLDSQELRRRSDFGTSFFGTVPDIPDGSFFGPFGSLSLGVGGPPRGLESTNGEGADAEGNDHDVAFEVRHDGGAAGAAAHEGDHKANPEVSWSEALRRTRPTMVKTEDQEGALRSIANTGGMKAGASSPSTSRRRTAGSSEAAAGNDEVEDEDYDLAAQAFAFLFRKPRLHVVKNTALVVDEVRSYDAKCYAEKHSVAQVSSTLRLKSHIAGQRRLHVLLHNEVILNENENEALAVDFSDPVVEELQNSPRTSTSSTSSSARTSSTLRLLQTFPPGGAGGQRLRRVLLELDDRPALMWLLDFFFYLAFLWELGYRLTRKTYLNFEHFCWDNWLAFSTVAIDTARLVILFQVTPADKPPTLDKVLHTILLLRLLRLWRYCQAALSESPRFRRCGFVLDRFQQLRRPLLFGSLLFIMACYFMSFLITSQVKQALMAGAYFDYEGKTNPSRKPSDHFKATFFSFFTIAQMTFFDNWLSGIIRPMSEVQFNLGIILLVTVMFIQFGLVNNISGLFVAYVIKSGEEQRDQNRFVQSARRQARLKLKAMVRMRDLLDRVAVPAESVSRRDGKYFSFRETLPPDFNLDVPEPNMSQYFTREDLEHVLHAEFEDQMIPEEEAQNDSSKKGDGGSGEETKKKTMFTKTFGRTGSMEVLAGDREMSWKECQRILTLRSDEVLDCFDMLQQSTNDVDGFGVTTDAFMGALLSYQGQLSARNLFAIACTMHKASPKIKQLEETTAEAVVQCAFIEIATERIHGLLFELYQCKGAPLPGTMKPVTAWKSRPSYPRPFPPMLEAPKGVVSVGVRVKDAEEAANRRKRQQEEEEAALKAGKTTWHFGMPVGHSRNDYYPDRFHKNEDEDSDEESD